MHLIFFAIKSSISRHILFLRLFFSRAFTLFAWHTKMYGAFNFTRHLKLLNHRYNVASKHQSINKASKPLNFSVPPPLPPPPKTYTVCSGTKCSSIDVNIIRAYIPNGNRKHVYFIYCCSHRLVPLSIYTELCSTSRFCVLP